MGSNNLKKQIIFSFDDGRIDTYTNAYRILKKYNMPCTINIATAFVEDESKFEGEFLTSCTKSMSIENVLECFNNGVEIAAHGDMHSNNVEDVRNSVKKLRAWGIDRPIGFASPTSYYCSENYSEIKPLVEDGTISYVRSGRRLRRDGFIYGALSVLAGKLHSKALFNIVNKRNIVKQEKTYDILPAVTVNANINVKQIKTFISKLKDGDSAILMYHAVIDENAPGIGADKWYNTIEEFDNLCKWISEQSDIDVITTRELVELM